MQNISNNAKKVCVTIQWANLYFHISCLNSWDEAWWFLSLRVFKLLQMSNNTGILCTCTWLWLMESEQVTPMDSIKDVVWSSVKVPEFDKHLKKVGGHIGQNIVKTLNDKNLYFPVFIAHHYGCDSFFGETIQ